MNWSNVLEVQLIRAREFIRVGPQGHLDLGRSRAILCKLTAACRKRGIRRALLDVRDLRSNFGPEELSELIRMFKDIGLPHVRRLALLHSGDPARRVRTLAMIASLRGWEVRAFGDFESAFAWLALTDTKSDSKADRRITHTHPADGHKIEIKTGEDGSRVRIGGTRHP